MTRVADLVPGRTAGNACVIAKLDVEAFQKTEESVRNVDLVTDVVGLVKITIEKKDAIEGNYIYPTETFIYEGRITQYYFLFQIPFKRSQT